MSIRLKIISRVPFFRDFYNVLKYGLAAPKTFEGLLINPRECKLGIHSKYVANVNPNYCSALVVNEWPLRGAVPVIDLPRVKFCIRHWEKNETWEEVGAYDRLRKKIFKNAISDHGIKTEQEIIFRYEKLNKIFEQIKKDGRFRRAGELSNNNFREKGSVLIHLGPNGELFFGLKGNHRFAIAYILNIPIPAQIGVVHESSLAKLQSLRIKY